jgi:hypothetical protein
MAVNVLERYKMAGATAWQWRCESGWVKKLSLSLGMACLIGLLAF